MIRMVPGLYFPVNSLFQLVTGNRCTNTGWRTSAWMVRPHLSRTGDARHRPSTARHRIKAAQYHSPMAPMFPAAGMCHPRRSSHRHALHPNPSSRAGATSAARRIRPPSSRAGATSGARRIRVEGSLRLPPPGSGSAPENVTTGHANAPLSRTPTNHRGIVGNGSPALILRNASLIRLGTRLVIRNHK